MFVLCQQFNTLIYKYLLLVSTLLNKKQSFHINTKAIFRAHLCPQQGLGLACVSFYHLWAWMLTGHQLAECPKGQTKQACRDFALTWDLPASSQSISRAQRFHLEEIQLLLREKSIPSAQRHWVKQLWIVSPTSVVSYLSWSLSMYCFYSIIF